MSFSLILEMIEWINVFFLDKSKKTFLLGTVCTFPMVKIPILQVHTPHDLPLYRHGLMKPKTLNLIGKQHPGQWWDKNPRYYLAIKLCYTGRTHPLLCSTAKWQ